MVQTNEWPEKAEDQVSEKGIVMTFPSWIGEAKGWNSTEKTKTLVFYGTLGPSLSTLGPI